MKSKYAKDAILNYNRVATSIIQYQQMYFNAWTQTSTRVRKLLNMPILQHNKDGPGIKVFLDTGIADFFKEGRFMMTKCNFEIQPDGIAILNQEEHIQEASEKVRRLKENYDELLSKVSPILAPVVQPFIDRVDKTMLDGFKIITWMSLQIDDYVLKSNEVINEMKIILDTVNDILNTSIIQECFDKISYIPLVELPEDESLTTTDFLEKTKLLIDTAKPKIALLSELAEENMFRLFSTLESYYTEDELRLLKNKSKQEHFPSWSYALEQYLYTKNCETMINLTKSTIDQLKKRAQTQSISYAQPKESKKTAFLSAEYHLEIPNIALSPNPESIIELIENVIQNYILSACEEVSVWSYAERYVAYQVLEKEAAKKRGDDTILGKQLQHVKQMAITIRENKEVTKISSLVQAIFGNIKVDTIASFDAYNDYSKLWKSNPKTEIEEFKKSDPMLHDYLAEIKTYHLLVEEIQAFPEKKRIGPIEVHLSKLKDSLISECTIWKKEFGNELNLLCVQHLDRFDSLVERFNKCFTQQIKDLDSVRSIMSELDVFREEELFIDNIIPSIDECYNIMLRYDLSYEDGNPERLDSFLYTYRNMKANAKNIKSNLTEMQSSMQNNLLSEISSFQKSSDEFFADYDSVGPSVSGVEPREASDRLVVFQARFDEISRTYQNLNDGETLFGLVHKEYPRIAAIKRDLNLLQKLYGLYNQVIASVDSYYEINWKDLDIEKVNNQLLDFQNKCRKLPKALKEWEAFNQLKTKLDDFSETCPILEMMANPAMLPRHWERIETTVSFKFKEADQMVLSDVMEAPLLKYRDDVEDICTSAVKEKDIDQKLKQVVAEWDAHEFSFSTFKTRGELLLKGADVSELIVFMEDSLMILSSLMSNRYNTHYKSTIQKWVQKLTTTTEIIEQWLQVQNLWVYLEAVFVGGDIAKQLPQEAKRFSTIDKSWQKVMQRAHEHLNVVQCCTADDSLSQILPHLLEQLEICQKSLTGYLEKKRLVFPRFFFVSDPVLLEILGQASDPHSIQQHLLSLFDNVYEVEFDEKQRDKIKSMYSREKEQVSFVSPIMATGNVEIWLCSLLDGVRNAVHHFVRNAWNNINEETFDLVEFEHAFPSQGGIIGIQMVWTKDAEIALKQASRDKQIMAKTNQSFLDMLNKLIEVTQNPKLTKYERTKFEALITIHVHQRDIFDELVASKVKSITDFDWLKQTRFYFDEETDKCVISITDVDFPYCNEYLGCVDRLVITPLTDRCYITLAQALGMDLGGAPAGPAGTGKTETTKDMARALGKYCVVFNCSDQMDYRGLGRIYKGLAQSGAWGCFDEFNRIELPVLSVAAQQISIILACKKAKKSEFIFMDGDVVSMDREFGLFLTMNPGYAGRQELPENLKIMFRCVSMIVPDRQIIIRVKLASAGFIENVILSKKFFTLYKLCEEQLSKQVHYDFGLRNILSVLRTLGGSKREKPDDPEIKVVMRGLRDMNLSKLVDEDEPLFMSLIDDLFPGMVVDVATYPAIDDAIDKYVNEGNLINHPPWKLKLIQLYETQRVRHGMMVLGPSGAGKTKCIHILMKAMGDCGTPHKELRMNPKAITAPQMFGTLDVSTNDWTDGIFSTLWRRTHKTKKSESVWLVLDGPVDAIWIENLNSVLDDNKTLTLANGDRIPMAPNCKIVFEPHNIDNASPATVSRNGMVFMSSSALDWNPIVRAWLNTEGIAGSTLQELFDGIFQDILDFNISSLSPKMDVLECMYARQIIDIIKGLMYSESEEKKSFEATTLNRFFILGVLWSVGGLLELEDRQKLEIFIRQHEFHQNLNLPPKGNLTMFDWKVDEDTFEWKEWSNYVENFIYPVDSIPRYTDILVPNVDNVRTEYLLNNIMKQQKSVLLIGEQGTAKTVMIQGYMSKYDPDEHLTKSVNFSSATTPGLVQRTIESYVEKRVGTTYGPSAGRKMTIFLDDVNMPIINEWKDQITNEIVRQVMENSGFYSLDKPGDFITIADIQYVAAMIHPGGGRNDIPQRLKRQFNIFNCTLPSDSSMDHIFSTIATGYFIKERGFSSKISETAAKLVSVTRQLWQATKAKMLPTPDKFHYIFNLRDLSRIWQGILKISSDICEDEGYLLSLWRHECKRVIADRFVHQDDLIWFDQELLKFATSNFEESTTNYITENEKELFVDFLREAPEATGEEDDDADLEAPKIYERSPTVGALNECLRTYQDSYNETVRGAKMSLVFFEDAMAYLVRISRIIRTDRGHGLLVGVGGSGKQSLTRLASFIAGYYCFQITLSRSYNVSNLLEDLKLLYIKAGKEGKGVSFIFTDNEIKDENFLEYINNVIASGEVSNLFAKDELDEICQELVPVMKREMPKIPPTNDNLYAFFISRVRENLHIVLCFSPVGEKFRQRALKFPGLFSGCTMSWFLRWPREALIQVAEHFLGEFKIDCTPEVKKALTQGMGSCHDVVAKGCVEYFERFRRQVHVTPKSYLGFIAGYKSVYEDQVAKAKLQFNRMNTGLEKLAQAEESIAILQEELVVKNADLKVASVEADKVLKNVTEKSEAAEKVKASVQIVKDKAQALVDSITKDKAVAMKKLEAAEPALRAAEEALATIKPADIALVKKLAKPPHLIMRIMDCVLILLGRPLSKVEKDPEKDTVKPSWGESVKLMNDTKFLSYLLDFNKDTITEEAVELCQSYMVAPDYNLETAKKVSGNVAGLCSWTMAMCTFFGINKEVLPLKANLVIQESKLEKANNELAIAQGQLDEKEAELKVVRAMFEKAMAEKQALVDDAARCEKKMSNAKALISGLSGEKVRWTETKNKSQEQITRLAGDAILAASFLSYAGPFNQQFRSTLLVEWRKIIDLNDIPCSRQEDLKITSMLADNPTQAQWQVEGLPDDELSVQNGVVVTNAQKYPLLIDPQGQGKTWIKNREKDNQLKITSMEDKYFRQHLEDALSLGQPLLIEDVGEELDPALDNVIEKNFIKSGSMFKVKVGDKECDVMKSFKLIITTKLANPRYSPEVYARSSIVDFTVTMQGLEDQLLGRVIGYEKQEVELERIKLVEDIASNKRKMQDLEDNLLQRLTSTKGSLVDDDSLIEVLNISKTTAQEVTEKLNNAAEAQLKISQAREEYRSVAKRGSILYFLIVEMSLVNIMYQTALSQFLGIFDQALERSPKAPVAAKRIAIIIDYLTFSVFNYTARGFYEEHKFLYALLLTLKIDLNRGKINHAQFQTFIKGGAALDLNTVQPKPFNWIQDLIWLNLVQLSNIPKFTMLLTQVANGSKAWSEWYKSDEPEENDLPDGYESSLDVFSKTLLIRSWCPDRAMTQAKKYVSDSMGKKYTDAVITDLPAMSEEADWKTPLICLLSMGSDPTDNIEKLARSKQLECRAVSMGQGQEVHARRFLQQCFEDGGYLLLQNCHLGLDYMQELLESLQNAKDVNPTFRCWITTEVHPKFSINLLQTSIKYSFDPPQGIKAGLRRTFLGVTQEQLDIQSLPQWKFLLYNVAFLHTIVQERRKFGPLGWNIPYEFNSSDYSASVQFIQNHLDDMDPKKPMNWNCIRYMLSEIQYGGRVTDDYDQRLLNTYAEVWFGDEIFKPGYCYYKGYTIPGNTQNKTPSDILSFITSLPDTDSPEAFGLHPNADISYSTNFCGAVLSTIVNIQPKESAGGEGETREEVVKKLALEFLDKMPADFIQHEVRARLAKMGKLQPMNIFLRQEIDRMQKVISTLRSTGCLS